MLCRTGSAAVEQLAGSVGRSAFSRVDVAAWYLDKVAAARPDDWRVHAHRAEAFLGLGRPVDAAAEQKHATNLGADPAYLADLAGDRAARGEWAKAAEYSAIAAARGATDHAHRALICLMTGDCAGYRQTCAALLASIAAGPARRDAAIEAAWAVGLAPAAVDDYARSIELASKAGAALDMVNDTSADFRRLCHDARRTHAAVLLRAGRLADAQAELAKAAALGDSDPLTDLLAAIAHARAGQIPAAEASLAKALNTITATAGQPAAWEPKAELDLLTAEARAAIRGRG